MSLSSVARVTQEERKNPAVSGWLIADGPSRLVRWAFIYLTTSWIDSEHLQRAGPPLTRPTCVCEAHGWRTEAETLLHNGPHVITETIAQSVFGTVGAGTGADRG